MKPILAILTISLGILIFRFIGHIISTKFLNKIKLNVEDKLLQELINIFNGSVLFLVLINLLGRLTGNFYSGFVGYFLLAAGAIAWQRNEVVSFCKNIGNYFKDYKNNLKKLNDYFLWGVLAVLNFIYGLTAFSTISISKPGYGNSHSENILQFLSGQYPLSYSDVPGVPGRLNHGADILAATLSKISMVNSEIAIDIVSLVFLNLSILFLYSISKKLSDGYTYTKYMVPLFTFLAWGPLVQLFKGGDKNLPEAFYQKINYLTQVKVVGAVPFTGNILYWFFEPNAGVTIFFFLVALYLIFKTLQLSFDVKRLIYIGFIASTFAFLDVAKLVIVLAGIVAYLIFIYSSEEEDNEKVSDKYKELLKNGIALFSLTAIFGLLQGGCLLLDDRLISVKDIYKIGKSSMEGKLGPYEANLILLVIVCFGFYKAYQKKDKLTEFLFSFFLVSLVLPYFVLIPNFDAGRIIVHSCLLGAIAIPFALVGIKDYLKLDDKNANIFYIACVLILCCTNLMYFTFGQRPKSLFKVEKEKIHFNGFQKIVANKTKTKKESEAKNKFPISGNEKPFIDFLKTKNTKGQGLLSELQLSKMFSSNLDLMAVQESYMAKTIFNAPVKKSSLRQFAPSYKASTSLDRKTWSQNNIKWLYLTHRLFRFLMPPQARQLLLNSYLNGGSNLRLSNNSQPTTLSELYEVNPNTLLFGAAKKPLKSSSYYLKQIALSPYFGVYSLMSNDFNGDMVSDVAFFDPEKLIWHTYDIKNEKASKVDLSKLLRNQSKGSFTPIPADYDGDGKTDIALFNDLNATWNILNSISQDSITSDQWCSYWSELPLPGDIDGDGLADYSCYNSTDRRWPALTASNRAYLAKSFNTTLADIVVYSDVDGNKKSDYLIYKPYLMAFHIYFDGCATTFDVNNVVCEGKEPGKVLEVSLGSENSRVVPADYDGDGKVDLGTWNPEDGSWEIAYAKDFLGEGEVVKKTFTLGKKGDIPMPGDYDGDGSDNIAVFHMSSGKLEVLFGPGEVKEIDLSKYSGLIPASFIGV